MNVLVKTSLGYDGISTITMNYCLKLSNDCSYTFFVVGCAKDAREDYLREIMIRGWRIVYAPNSFRHFFKYKRLLHNTVKNGNFDIFHINGNSSLMLVDYMICKKASKKTKIITHSHNSNCSHPALHYLLKPLFAFTKPIRIACSDIAGKWAFGSKSFVTLPNVIDYSSFLYNDEFRNELRHQYNLFGKKVILHVGAFVEAKNHKYIVDILKRLFASSSDYVAVFVGNGPTKKAIAERLSLLGLSDRVIFAGQQTNVSHYYSMADVLILPSLYEGLPVVLLEAQVSGLPCLVSDTVSNQVKISERIFFLGIQNKDINSWINAIDIYSSNISRVLDVDDAFSVEKASKKLLTLYLS